MDTPQSTFLDFVCNDASGAGLFLRPDKCLYNLQILSWSGCSGTMVLVVSNTHDKEKPSVGSVTLRRYFCVFFY